MSFFTASCQSWGLKTMGVIAGFIGLATAIACFVPGVIISPVTPHEYNPFF